MAASPQQVSGRVFAFRSLGDPQFFDRFLVEPIEAATIAAEDEEFHELSEVDAAEKSEESSAARLRDIAQVSCWFSRVVMIVYRFWQRFRVLPRAMLTSC